MLQYRSTFDLERDHMYPLVRHSSNCSEYYRRQHIAIGLAVVLVSVCLTSRPNKSPITLNPQRDKQCDNVYWLFNHHLLGFAKVSVLINVVECCHARSVTLTVMARPFVPTRSETGRPTRSCQFVGRYTMDMPQSKRVYTLETYIIT